MDKARNAEDRLNQSLMAGCFRQSYLFTMHTEHFIAMDLGEPQKAKPLDARNALLGLFYEELTVGRRAVAMRTVMETDLNDFADISGDTNPIHLCEDYAAGTRFGQRIAHGMFTASLISALIGTKLPGPGAIYLSQSLQFLGPMRIGDVVTVVVEVVELVPARRRARLHCECIVDGKPVLEGEAWVAVPGRSAS